MRNGVLRRDLVWTTPAGKHVRVQSCRLVSFEHRHVAALSYEVSVDRPAAVALVSRLLTHDRDPRAEDRRIPASAAGSTNACSGTASPWATAAGSWPATARRKAP